MRSLAAIDPGGLAAGLRGVTIIVASDVDNRLLGPDGAAAVFAPQKGATAADVRDLEDGLTRLDTVARRDLGADAADRPGAGAAGGAGFGAMAFLGATVRPGIAYLLDLLGFPDRVAGARLVITGEGSLDRQSLHGKAPVGVARAAARYGVPAIAVAGRCELTGAQLRGGLREARPHRHRTRPRPVHGAGRPAAGTAGRAHRPGRHRPRGRRVSYDLVVRSRRAVLPDGER